MVRRREALRLAQARNSRYSARHILSCKKLGANSSRLFLRDAELRDFLYDKMCRAEYLLLRA